MSDSWWHNILGVFTLDISFKHYDGLRKAACLFAGLGHLQPLLLATTNSHYLLDRFCMERCCSSEYVSRIVTSIIFMEILSIIVVRIVLIILPTGLGTIIGIGNSIWSDPNLTETAQLNKHTQNDELGRGILGSIILCLITIGYIQILLAFLSGGKKGHMHWFYASLLIQHFLNSLIAGSIGFWDVGLALWYLVTLPMAPIVVFFYQMIIHSWIRNNGPRYPERLIVERQIWLALSISALATFFWVATYSKPIIPIELKLDLTSSASHDTDRITVTDITVKPTEITVNVKAVQSGNPEITVKAEVAVKSGETVKAVNLTITVKSAGSVQPVAVYKKTIEVSVTGNKITLEKQSGTIINVTTSGGTPTQTVTGDSVKVNFSSVTPTNLGSDTYTYKTFAPNDGYCIYSVRDTANDIWVSGGNKCFYAECYYKNTNNTDPALLHLKVYTGDTLTMKYFGRESGGDWKEFKTGADFIKNLGKNIAALAKGSLTLPDDSKVTDQYNREYNKVLGPWYKPAATWAPIIMQGLSVGAVGSIFPNLIPKTLVCARTTRTLSVINMFLVTLPHIFNVMLGDNDVNPASNPWTDWDKNTVWPFSLLLYIIYTMAILFAIFNIHYPEWRLSCFLRNNTWFVFLMILFTDVLNETFNAISRAGICSQRAAGQDGKKNHPCLHNKIACLNALELPLIYRY